MECERLLGEARKCVTAMQGLAEIDGDNFKLAEAKKLLEKDIAPLQQEVSRALKGGAEGADEENNLFYRPPQDENGGDEQQQTMQSLISSSEDMLLESRA